MPGCEYGTPLGTPVFYFHGIPGSRIDGRGDLLAERVTRLAIASGVAPSEMPDYRKAVCPTDKTMTFLSLRAPLHLWHGEDDRTVSVSHSRWIASEVRSAELTVWPGEGHLHTPERWAEVYAAVAERIRPPGV